MLKEVWKTHFWSHILDVGTFTSLVSYKRRPIIYVFWGAFSGVLSGAKKLLNRPSRIPYPDSGAHDPLLVDVIQRCLVRDPAERASVEQLLEHPYLKKSPHETPSQVRFFRLV